MTNVPEIELRIHKLFPEAQHYLSELEFQASERCHSCGVHLLELLRLTVVTTQEGSTSTKLDGFTSEQAIANWRASFIQAARKDLGLRSW
jgi:hypothetical protein